MSENVTITGSQAIELLRRAVAEKGRDHVAKGVARNGTVISCVYRDVLSYDSEKGEWTFPEGPATPICGVGYAFSYLGLLDQITGRTNGISVMSVSFDHADLSGDAVDIFDSFQYAQDAGEEWGEALDNAERTAARLGVLDAVKQA